MALKLEEVPHFSAAVVSFFSMYIIVMVESNQLKITLEDFLEADTRGSFV